MMQHTDMLGFQAFAQSGAGLAFTLATWAISAIVFVGLAVL